jgi:hypothetical protein
VLAIVILILIVIDSDAHPSSSRRSIEDHEQDHDHEHEGRTIPRVTTTSSALNQQIRFAVQLSRNLGATLFPGQLNRIACREINRNVSRA